MPSKRRNNTPELWDELWAEGASLEQDLYALEKERAGVRFRRLRNRIVGRFGRFDGLKVVEVGAGAGTNAALCARLGAEVTILDYSDAALDRSRIFFERNGLTATRIRGDALRIPAELLGVYDVSMSFGLAEHFVGEMRAEIVRSHLDLLRPGGMTFVSVPNRANLPYRLSKLIAERTGRWKVGEEHPYSRAEFAAICAALDVREYSFFGDSLWHSLSFVNPIVIGRNVRGVKPDLDRSRIGPERGTLLDARFAYALVLCVVKDLEHAPVRLGEGPRGGTS